MTDSESSSAENVDPTTNETLEKKKAKAIIKCSKGHKLKYTSPKVLNSKGYNNSYDCDLCLNTFHSEGSYHCSKCKHDLCENCYDNRADGKCPNHHQLQSSISNDATHKCKSCNNTIDEGITYHGCTICDYDLCSNCFSYKDDKAPKKKDGGFSNFGALGELLQMIDTHMVFMDQQETNVDDFIDKSGSADLLRKAKTAALETEKELMQGIMNISEMNEFLNNIILVENLFNSIYTKDFKAKQESARDKYASNIAVYEQKKKPECDIASFVELMFAGTNLHISSFKKWLKKVVDECEEKDVEIVESSGARGKNIERAFYKSFYVYAVDHGDDGYKQMTDVLRCSLVFDDFNALYQCFAIIEELVSQEETAGGILRVKDRFHPAQVPFGYRDMLINMYSPGSKVVAEIQLHHKLFFNHKAISHDIYKKARLFEENEENMAYKYADGHIRKVIGDKKYKTKKNKSKSKAKSKKEIVSKQAKSKGDQKEDPTSPNDDDDDEKKEDHDQYFDKKFARVSRMVNERHHIRLSFGRFKTNTKFNIQAAAATDESSNTVYMDEVVRYLLYSEVEEDTIRQFAQFVAFHEYDVDSMTEDIKQASQGNIAVNIGDEEVIKAIAEFVQASELRSSSFNIGLTFYYWPEYEKMDAFDANTNSSNLNDHGGYEVRDLFVKRRHVSFKEEIMAYAFVSMAKYEVIMTKVKEYLKTNSVKQIKAYNESGRLNYNIVLKYGIPHGSVLFSRHLLALFLYTDCTDLCTHFSATFRANKQYEALSAIKARNSKYWWMAKSLREMVELYGEYKTWDDDEG
eukprot:827940_1